MIRHFAFLTLLQEGVYVAEKSPDHQNVSLRAVILSESPVGLSRASHQPHRILHLQATLRPEQSLAEAACALSP